MNNLLKTVTVATFDLVLPASLDTTHLYCCDCSKVPTTSVLLLLFLMFIHCPPLILPVSQKYIIDPVPVPSQSSVTLILIFIN